MADGHLNRVVKRALISVFHKEPVRALVQYLHHHGVEIISTGGTYDYIRSLEIPAREIESITGYPSILGGRVKTLHPLVFGGILSRRDSASDIDECRQYGIGHIDLVVVDLYPFEKTVSSGKSHEEIIEKIDIGGVSLIRAAAKNYRDVAVLASLESAALLMNMLESGNGALSLDDRKQLAIQAFDVTSGYDAAIFNYFRQDAPGVFNYHIRGGAELRYGENPHQSGYFYGDLSDNFVQLQGKALSYNNLLDIDAAMGLIAEFEEPAFAIIKHTNVCGFATGADLLHLWKGALAGDPVSAFGGILVTNRTITSDVAMEIGRLFFEVLIAPGFDSESLAIFSSKKNRIVLQSRRGLQRTQRFRSVLTGVLWQTEDEGLTAPGNWQIVTKVSPSNEELADLAVANAIVKHLKSNAIALVCKKQLLGMGAGQTSRVDALKQAIEKAASFGHDLNGAVMASDAFFPFPDCVEIAHKAGIKAVIQPGGSVRDQESIDYCDSANMSMAFTGRRHFRH